MDLRAPTWHLRVSSAGRDVGTVFVRKHRFTVGAPVQFDEEYPGVTAVEHVLGAFAADVTNGLYVTARRRRVELDRVEARIEGTLENPLTHLAVVGESGSPRIDGIVLKVYASTMAEQEDVDRVWEETLERSPLVQTFRSCVKLDLGLEVVL